MRHLALPATLLAVGGLGLGCPGHPTPGPLEVPCAAPLRVCCVELTLDMDDLHACYGADPPTAVALDHPLLEPCTTQWGQPECVLRICEEDWEDPLYASVDDEAWCERGVATGLEWTGSAVRELDRIDLEVDKVCTLGRVEPPSGPLDCG